MRYVWSPYQTTLAEAGQDKFLLVLDKDGDGGSGDGAWKCVEEIQLTVGRKHWTISSIEELFDLPIGLERVAADSVLRTGHKETRTMVVSGDRVVVSIQKDGLEKLRRDANSNDDDEGGGDSNSSSRSRELVSKFDDKVKAIRSLGASIEIREVSSVATSPMMATGGVASGDNETDAMDWLLVEDMSPSATWSQFIAKEVEREVMDNETAQFLLEAGSSVLLLQGEDGTHNETKTGSPNGDGSSKSSMDLCLESVYVKGFGPFKKSITYPLNDRGLVLLRGSSNDLGSDRYVVVSRGVDISMWVCRWNDCVFLSFTRSKDFGLLEIRNTNTRLLFVYSPFFILGVTISAMAVEILVWPCLHFGR